MPIPIENVIQALIFFALTLGYWGILSDNGAVGTTGIQTIVASAEPCDFVRIFN